MIINNNFIIINNNLKNDKMNVDNYLNFYVMEMGNINNRKYDINQNFLS